MRTSLTIHPGQDQQDWQCQDEHCTSGEEPADGGMEQAREEVLSLRVRLEKKGAEGGAEGERVEGRNEGGKGDGQRTLPVGGHLLAVILAQDRQGVGLYLAEGPRKAALIHAHACGIQARTQEQLAHLDIACGAGRAVESEHQACLTSAKRS